jgi:hypothetical protein
MRALFLCPQRMIRFPYPSGMAVFFLVTVIILVKDISALRNHSPENASTIGNTYTAGVTDCHVPVISEQMSQQPVGEKTELPIVCRYHTLTILDALRQSDSTLRGGELRHSEFNVSLAPRGGSAHDQSLLRLYHIGIRQAVCPQSPLEILFCTWQI